MTWVVGLTVLFLYVYAVVGCELYYHSASEGVAADFEEATGVTLREYWGTVGRALLTLMQVMTFDSWADFVRPLVHATRSIRGADSWVSGTHKDAASRQVSPVVPAHRG